MMPVTRGFSAWSKMPVGLFASGEISRSFLSFCGNIERLTSRNTRQPDFLREKTGLKKGSSSYLSNSRNSGSRVSAYLPPGRTAAGRGKFGNDRHKGASNKQAI